VERLGHVLNEIRALSQTARAQLAARVAPPVPAEERMGLDLRPGQKVYDLVTGQVGEVLGGSRAHYVVPTARR